MRGDSATSVRRGQDAGRWLLPNSSCRCRYSRRACDPAPQPAAPRPRRRCLGASQVFCSVETTDIRPSRHLCPRETKIRSLRSRSGRGHKPASFPVCCKASRVDFSELRNLRRLHRPRPRRRIPGRGSSRSLGAWPGVDGAILGVSYQVGPSNLKAVHLSHDGGEFDNPCLRRGQTCDPRWPGLSAHRLPLLQGLPRMSRIPPAEVVAVPKAAQRDSFSREISHTRDIAGTLRRAVAVTVFVQDPHVFGR